MSESIKANVCFAYDTAANWQAADPLLQKGQVVAVTDGTKRRLKVGDGANAFNTLPYIDDFLQSYTIDAAVPTTNPGAPNGGRVWETSTAGTYTFFKDISNASIVVNSGEFVHLVDNGSYYSKVIVPFSTGDLAQKEDIENILDTNFAPYLGDVHEVTNGKDAMSFGTVLVDPSKYHFDPKMSFDVTRINEVFFNMSFAGQISYQLISVDLLSGLVTVHTTASTTFASPGINSVNVAAWRSAYPAGQYYIAAKTGTGGAITTTANSAFYTARITGPGFVVLQNTAVNIYFSLTDQRRLEVELERDASVRAIKKTSVSIPLDENDSVVIVDSVGNDMEITLPTMNIPTGKIYTIKYKEADSLAVSPFLGIGLVEGANPYSTTTQGAYTFIYDGKDWNLI